jgi:hypothetical protein
VGHVSGGRCVTRNSGTASGWLPPPTVRVVVDPASLDESTGSLDGVSRSFALSLAGLGGSHPPAVCVVTASLDFRAHIFDVLGPCLGAVPFGIGRAALDVVTSTIDAQPKNPAAPAVASRWPTIPSPILEFGRSAIDSMAPGAHPTTSSTTPTSTPSPVTSPHERRVPASASPASSR